MKWRGTIMQKLQCELCSSVDIIKIAPDIFQCQHCGCKYTLEQVKSIISGQVKVTGIKTADDYANDIRTLIDRKQYDRARAQVRRALEVYPVDSTIEELAKRLEIEVNWIKAEAFASKIAPEIYASEDPWYIFDQLIIAAMNGQYDLKRYDKTCSLLLDNLFNYCRVSGKWDNCYTWRIFSPGSPCIKKVSKYTIAILDAFYKKFFDEYRKALKSGRVNHLILDENLLPEIADMIQQGEKNHEK